MTFTLNTIHQYTQHLLGKGLAAKTIKSYLEPLKATGKRVVAEHPDYYRDPCYGFRLPRRIGDPKTVAEKTGRRGLSIMEVVQLYQHLLESEDAKSVAVAVLLCGLLGLRVREAVHLTWRNIDLERGLIRIEEEEGHSAKTAESVRMLPLPMFVRQELMALKPHGDRVIRLVSRCSSKPQSSRPDNLIGQRFAKRMKHWKPERYLPLSDLRNTLINTARKNPVWSERLVEQFVGHVDSSVSGKNYQATDPEEVFGAFRDHLLPLLEEEIGKALKGTKWQQNGNNSAGPAPSSTAQIIDIVAV